MLTSEHNLGFGRANNWALRVIGFGERPDDELPSAVYFLNPDTITKPGATRALYDVLMADDSVGIVGPQLEYSDGAFQHSAFRFPGLKQLWVEFFPTPGRLIDAEFNGRYAQTDYANHKPFAIDFPLGAAMMIKREVIAATGMFDEQFFMYCEEIDWAWRIRKAGWGAKCVPSAQVVHLGGQSTSQVRPESLVNLWTSRLRLYRKHHPRWKVFVARFMIWLGMRLKIRQLPSLDAEQNSLREAYDHIARSARK
ncbi:MAG: glycosyltransferase family 2 protein [Chloroflexi bacterium]|nr:MAG: glycosyltransferase family 2 protein [Chloroflexota bacterium]